MLKKVQNPYALHLALVSKTTRLCVYGKRVYNCDMYIVIMGIFME